MDAAAVLERMEFDALPALQSAQPPGPQPRTCLPLPADWGAALSGRLGMRCALLEPRPTVLTPCSSNTRLTSDAHIAATAHEQRSAELRLAVSALTRRQHCINGSPILKGCIATASLFCNCLTLQGA